MSTQVKPAAQFQFHGINTAGNPLDRPRNSASKCTDFRVMPGFWLRTRGGQVAQSYTADTIQQIFPFRDVGTNGASNHLAQVKNVGGATANWNWFNLNVPVISPTGIEAIDVTNDSGFALNNPVAVTNLSDRPLFYNGLGVRTGTESKTPFSTYFGGITRYYGLDAYCPSGKPSASFAAGAGFNQVLTSVKIYVGLYHEPTGHYSNGVLAGTITTTGATGTITVSSLGNLKATYHNVTERSELFYVFYATIDGGEVPYLIFNSALDGPLKTAVTNSSISLSIAAVTVDDPNGWILDLTKESPVDNFPPRPMRSVAFVNGRVYGSPMNGGGGTGADFTYPPSGRDLAGVVWSRASGDVNSTEFLGDPQQSWPLTNIAYTPSADQALVVTPALDDVRVLVITSTATFLLEEVADGLHEFITISRINGIANPSTLRVTPYGIVWMDQNKQIVLLPPNSLDLQTISTSYQPSIVSTPRTADYLLNPVHEIDRYEVFFADGTSLSHDFRIGGEAYISTGRDFTAARTCINSDGAIHHLVAKNGIFTQEAQPGTGLIPTTDQNWSAPTTIVTTQISGSYERNWDDFGDANERKEIFHVDVVGDGANSDALATSPMKLEWYPDFIQVISGNKLAPAIAKAPQSTTDSMYRFKLQNGKRFWYKFVFKMAGHSSDDASFVNHVPPAQQGDLSKNFYGSILRLLFSVGQTSVNSA